MGGLARICKMYGEIVINGNKLVWDYVADKGVPVEDMPQGSERWKASERKKWADIKAKRPHNSQGDRG